jgi:hypothetical protein
MKVDRSAMAADIRHHPEVYAEKEQISLRLKGDESGYEKVKSDIEQGRFRPGEVARDEYLGYAVRLAKDCPGIVSSLLKPSS